MAKKPQKNTAAVKTKKSSPPKDIQRETLAKELSSLIPQLDSEGLAFLIEQGRIHLYNMQVDEMNKEAMAAGKAAGAAENSRVKGTSKKAAAEFRIEGAPSGSSYYLYYRNNDVMFTGDEMMKLVKIANSKGTDLEIRERLYNWFDRERKDVFSVIPMADKFDKHLKEFAAHVRKRFKIRQTG